MEKPDGEWDNAMEGEHSQRRSALSEEAPWRGREKGTTDGQQGRAGQVTAMGNSKG